MLILDERHARRLLGLRGSCPFCGNSIERCYCTDHDDTVDVGHDPSCLDYPKDSEGEPVKNHLSHRLQRYTDDPYVLMGFSDSDIAKVCEIDLVEIRLRDRRVAPWAQPLPACSTCRGIGTESQIKAYQRYCDCRYPQ